MKLTKKLTALLQDKPDAPCKIWSEPHKMWWTEKCKGYTPDCTKAGIYTITNAIPLAHKCGKIVPLQCVTIMVAQNYLACHPKKGQPTGFEQAILDGTKIHTIRADYEGWVKKAEKINAGLAYLSLRKWSGLPYRSNVVEIKRLFGVGVQKVTLESPNTINRILSIDSAVFSPLSTTNYKLRELAKNDGFLYHQDLLDWFQNKPFEGAIIHFTNFRY